MNALPDPIQLVTVLLDALPAPAALVDEHGRVWFANGEMRARANIPERREDAAFADVFPEYASALGEGPPWRTQELEVARAAAADGVHEKLCVRNLPFGTCIIVTECADGKDSSIGDVQTARLASLGFMVAGVCHELANPLTAINSMVQLLQSTRPLSSETLDRGLANIAANVRRVLNISRRLNDFSRAGCDERRPLPLVQPIAEAIQNIIQDNLPPQIEIDREVDTDLWIVGSADQLEQVFANLVRNAVQAIDGAGRIRIVARAVDERLAEVAVRDSGPGIAPGHLARLFEPFFTTKPAGHGTGLGLTISNEIVLEHGGFMRAENHPEGGACVYVTLPLHHGKR